MTEKKLPNFCSNAKYVKLDVGGHLYSTTISTLTKYDTMLKAMFSVEMQLPINEEGYIFIDRCGKHFGKILNFFRDGEITLPKSEEHIIELLAEAKYCISELVSICVDAVNKGNIEEKLDENFFKKIPPTYYTFKLNAIEKTKSLDELAQTSPRLIIFFVHKNEIKQEFQSYKILDEHIKLLEELSAKYNKLIPFVKCEIELQDTAEKDMYMKCCWCFYLNGKRTHLNYCISNEIIKPDDGQICKNILLLLESLLLSENFK